MDVALRLGVAQRFYGGGKSIGSFYKISLSEGIK